MKKTLTLIEVLVAIAIFAFISVAIYSLLRTGILVRKRVTLEQNLYQSTCLTLDRIAQELRSAVFFKKDEAPLKGAKQSLEFYTIVFDYPTDTPRVLHITYNFEDGSLTKAIKGPLALEVEKEIIFLEDIKDFKFSYFGEEESEWQEVWDNKDKLPCGVKIKLTSSDEKGQESSLDKHIFIYTESSPPGGKE